MEPEFKVESRSIDTAALEEEISRRVAERRRAGVYTHEVESMLAERLPDEEYATDLPPAAALDYAATRASAGWEVTASYPVETEKRLVRPLVIFAKRIARLWARIAVGPIQREQTAYNRHVASALDALRRQAIAERAEALAAEEDLASLAEAMIGSDEARGVEAAVTGALGGTEMVMVLGPCPQGLKEAMTARGVKVHGVSAGTTWDNVPATGSTRTGPLAFLSQVPEESLDVLIACELAFWLRPEALIDLARRSYLALSSAGRLLVVVHSFALGTPAPAWCASPVVEKALDLAGFKETAVISLPGGTAEPSTHGYVAVARKS